MKDCIQIHADSNIHLHTDPEAFLKIITELVVNTMQHGFSDGQAIGQIDIRLSLEAGNLLFTYADNGSGIDAADVPLVFDPFYTTARGTEAVGLGLHTVFNLVTRRLHGSIECISRPEQGSEFIMCIPTDGGGEGDLGQR